MTQRKICGDCLRFNRYTTPNKRNLGLCKFSRVEELDEKTEACEHFVTDIKIERERSGFFVVLEPSSERKGPFPTYNRIDEVRLAVELDLKPKVLFKAKLRVPPSEVENYDMFEGTQFVTLDNRAKGVAFGDQFFLHVERTREKWRFRLLELPGEISLTGWVSVPDIEDLRISQKARPIRKVLKGKFPDHLVTLERAIMLIQDCKDEWKKEDVETPTKETAKIPKVELTTSEEVSDVFAYNGDRKFNSRIQIKSLGFPKARFQDLTLRYKYTDSSGEENVDEHKLDFEGNFDASAFATYFDSNNPRDAFVVLRQKGTIFEGSYTSAKGTKETAITQAVVSDRAGNEAKCWFVHSEKSDLRRGPNWIFAKGWLCRGKYGRIGTLILEFQNESEVMQPDKKTVEESKAYLRGVTNDDEPTVWKIARALHRKSNLKGKETTRGFVSDLLNVGSCIWTKTPEGPKVLAMTSVEIGETTTAKSQRIREIIAWLKAGKYESGKKTSAGLAAGAEKIEGMGWVMRKGLLPSADLSFIILDNMFPNALDAFVESRRNGIIMLSTIKACELWARTRLKLLSNPNIPFDQYLNKCVALKVYDSKFIARFTFATFTYGVDPETRYNPRIQKLSEENHTILNAAWNVLRWNLSKEIIYTVPLELWPKIMQLSKQLELKFGNEEIPLFLRANPHKIATLSYCFALFEGVEPSERHIDQAYKWLNQCGKDIELDEFTAQWKQDHTLSDEEYETLNKTINERIIEEIQTAGGDFREASLYCFLKYVAKHGQVQMEEIAASTGISDRTTKRRARELKGLGLIKSSRAGYFFTAKGVRFYKRWLKEVNSGLDDLNDLNSKRHRLSESEKQRIMHKTNGQLADFPVEQGVTPENKVNRAIGATSKLPLAPKNEDDETTKQGPIPSKQAKLPEEPRTLKNEVNGETKEPVTDFTIVECVDLKEPTVESCAHCSKIKALTKQIKTADGNWGRVCKSCGEFFDEVVKKAEKRDKHE